MKIFTKTLKFKKAENAATAIEYALIVALIAIVIIISVSVVGGQLNYTFSNVSSSMTSANDI